MSDDRRRFPLARDDVDYPALAVELGAALGRPVALCATAPAAAEGGQGVLILVDPATGEALGSGVDAGTVARVVAAHVRPPAPPLPAEILDERLVTATTVAALRGALREYAQAEIQRGRPPAPGEARAP